MSTRSLTVVDDDSGQEIMALFGHFDGYPSCHGVDLAEFLAGRVTNRGMGPKGRTDNPRELIQVVGHDPESFMSNSVKNANGMNCLAAMIVAHFKDNVGGFYLFPAGFRGHGEYFIYHVSRGDDEPMLLIMTARDKEVLFHGTASEVLQQLLQADKEEEPDSNGPESADGTQSR